MISALRLRAWMLGIVAALAVTSIAQAQQTGRTPFWDPTRGGESPRLTYSSDGYLRSAGAPAGSAFNARAAGATSPEAVALAFINGQARWFFDGNTGVTFTTARVKSGQTSSSVRLNQTYNGLSIYAAAVTVQVKGNAVEFVLSDIMRNFGSLQNGTLQTAPSLTAAQAQAVAVHWAASETKSQNPAPTDPQLVIYDPVVVGNHGAAMLAWNLEVSDPDGPMHEVLLINAVTGKVAFHYSLIEEAMFRIVRDANNTSSTGVIRRTEGGAVTGITQVDQAYDYLGDTYAFYETEHGRNSIDNADLALDATVRYCDPFEACPYGNAFWDGSRMWFGDGFQVDDVTGHELTHGVTQYESGLIYANQSGAMNESFSDMWGEWIDQGNGAGNDTPGVRWLMGEELGAIRNMQDPTAFGDPDRMGSPNYYNGPFDGGGVHINSGVGNKLAYLLTDGDTFNGYTVTGFGVSLAADLMYECQSNLLGPGSDYGDLYDALHQAAINLGLSAGQRNNVENACRAVEIKFTPGVTDFYATTQDSVAQIDLTWNNPSVPGFTGVRVRRSTTAYPADPDADGTLVYQGSGTSYTDTAVTLNTIYYYTIWAYDGPDDHSIPSMAAAQAGINPRHPTELFRGMPDDVNDLQAITLTYTPDGPDGYTVSGITAYSFPTPPGGTALLLGDDDYTQVNLTNLETIPFYGLQYSSVWVSANGRVLFGALSSEFDETLAHHFAVRSLAALFDDLDPSAGGTITTEQLADRLVVTYQDIKEFGPGNFGDNDFQFELFFDGTLRVTYLVCNALDGLAGISPGGGVPLGFGEYDLTEGATFIPPAPVRAGTLVAAAALIALLAAFGLRRSQLAR